MKLLIYGDVVGKLGRAGVKLTIDEWKKEYDIDIVIANIENIAHGKGIGREQIAELKAAGVDIFTGGNHSIKGKDNKELLNDETLPLLRPLNMVPGTEGRGTLTYEIKNENSKYHGTKLIVVNLIGQVNMKQNYDSPFFAIDEALKTSPAVVYKIVDWHADATSEKEIMGWYLDGKVSAVFGTHTHVPTADARILPMGTGYISDVGMVGAHHSIIGVDVASSIERFKKQIMAASPLVEEGPIEVNALALEVDDQGKTVDIQHLRKIIESYTI